MLHSIKKVQETHLSPIDHAMRRVSWNLANYHVSSPEQIEVMKLKRYNKAMCNKHVHSTTTRRDWVAVIVSYKLCVS